MKSILLSINPKWAEKILSGEKTIEVRKTAPITPCKVYLYATKPICRVVGEFVCGGVTDCFDGSCLTQDELDEYGGGKALYGWTVKDAARYYKPLELENFIKENGATVTYPPQSWMYARIR